MLTSREDREKACVHAPTILGGEIAEERPRKSREREEGYEDGSKGGLRKHVKTGRTETRERERENETSKMERTHTVYPEEKPERREGEKQRTKETTRTRKDVPTLEGG